MVAIQQITNASVDIFRNFYILCKGEGGGKKKQTSFRQPNWNLSNRNYLGHNLSLQLVYVIEKWSGCT